MNKAISFNHTRAMEAALQAFIAFNDRLVNAHHSGLLEVTEIVVTMGGDKYVRLYFDNEEAYAEPLFDIVTDLDTVD